MKYHILNNLRLDLRDMNKVTITCSNGPIELSEFVEDFYSVSKKANRALKELRRGLPTWTTKETYKKMQLSLWVYDSMNYPSHAVQWLLWKWFLTVVTVTHF